jgi:membrane protease YdiL (CAAX protease family)
MTGQPYPVNRPAERPGPEQMGPPMAQGPPPPMMQGPPPPVVYPQPYPYQQPGYYYPPPGYYQPYPPPPPGPYPYGPYPYYPPRPPDPLRFLNPLWVIGIFILVILITLVISIPVAFFAIIGSSGSAADVVAALTTPAMVLTLLVIQDLTLILTPYFVYFRNKALTWAELGLSSMSLKDAVNRVGLGLVAGLAYAAVILAITKIINYSGTGSTPEGELNSLTDYIMLMIGGSIVAPISEEFFFRGIAFGGAKKWLDHKGFGNSFTISLAFSSIFFAAVHGYDIFGTTVVMIAGIIFALLYFKTKSLVSPILAHAVYNGVLITVDFMHFS